MSCIVLQTRRCDIATPSVVPRALMETSTSRTPGGGELPLICSPYFGRALLLLLAKAST